MGHKLSYSFHLGSDKNNSKLAKKVAKGNVSGTTSLSNNAIQTAKDLQILISIFPTLVQNLYSNIKTTI